MKYKTRLEAEQSCDLWGIAGEDVIHHKNADEAIAAYVADIPKSDLPVEIELVGYLRMCVTRPPGSHPLRDLVEELDSIYGDPYNYTKLTPAMVKAEDAFLAAVMGDYTSWACVDVYHEKLNPTEWLAERRAKAGLPDDRILCADCATAANVAVYDRRKARLLLCADCAVGLGSPLLSSADLPMVAGTGICWCHLADHGLQIRWCPHVEPRPVNS